MFLVAHPFSSYPTAPVSPYHQMFSMNLRTTHLDRQHSVYDLDLDSDEDYRIVEQLAAHRFMQERRNEVAHHRAIATSRIMQQRREHEYQVAVCAAREEAHRVHVARVRTQEAAKSQYLEHLRREELQRILHARETNNPGQHYGRHHHAVNPHAVHRSRAQAIEQILGHEEASSHPLDQLLGGLNNDSLPIRRHASVSSRPVPEHMNDHDNLLGAILGSRQVRPAERKSVQFLVKPQELSTSFSDFLEDAFAVLLANDLKSQAYPSAKNEPGTNDLPTPTSASRSHVQDRIPFGAKGKWRAPHSSTISPQVPPQQIDEQTAAQLAADAAFAAELQAEEDRLAASRRFARHSTFFDGRTSSVPSAAVKKPDAGTSSHDSKSPQSLEDLLRSRASEETDLDVLLTINKLLQQFSSVTSPIHNSNPFPIPAASSTTPASAAAPAIARTSSRDTLSRISNTLQDLTHGFVLPPLDFTPRPASPSSASATASTLDLAFTPANQSVHAQEAALSRLLDQLDAIDAEGDNELRAKRRDLVKEVERALGEIERAVEEKRQGHSSLHTQMDTRAETKDAADVDSMEGYHVTFDVEELPMPTQEADEDAKALSEAGIPSPSQLIQVGHTVDDSKLAPALNALPHSAAMETALSAHAPLAATCDLVGEASAVSRVAPEPSDYQEEAKVTPASEGSAKEASQPLVPMSSETTQAPVPVAPRPISLHTFPPGPSPLAAAENIDLSSESDLDSTSDDTQPFAVGDTSVDVDTFLLPASRPRSPVLHPNNVDSSDEEGVLLIHPTMDAARSDGEWSELESEA